MGSIGAPELIVIALIALLLFGAGRIADIGKGLGQGIKNFKQGIKEADDDDKDDDKDEKPAKKAAAKSEKSEKSEKSAKSSKKDEDEKETEKEAEEA
jgi:sec-independent protein translocase protein TatA